MMVVAEVGASHHRKISNVLRMIRETDANALKIQTWYEDSMAVSHVLKSGPWIGRDLVDLYRKARLPWEWHQEIFDYCRVRNIVPFSTPFDRQSVEFLERLNCAMYKVASFEMVDLRLVACIAETGKPLLMSTGQSESHEIRAAVTTAQKYHNDITLLHCVSQYPTETSEVNLKTMRALRRFDTKIGLSDHSDGDVVPIMAATLGASVIEKHICLHKQGLDGAFAMTPPQFNRMARKVRQVSEVMGEVKFGGDHALRRSLYFTQDLPAGTRVIDSHIKTARPNKGLSPLTIHKVVGQVLSESVTRDQPVLLAAFRK